MFEWRLDDDGKRQTERFSRISRVCLPKPR